MTLIGDSIPTRFMFLKEEPVMIDGAGLIVGRNQESAHGLPREDHPVLNVLGYHFTPQKKLPPVKQQVVFILRLSSYLRR